VSAKPIAVSVPATSANLGCAFDCAAVALNRYLRASLSPDPAPGLTLDYRGPHPERVPRDETNLVLRGIHKLAGWAGKPLPGGRVRVNSEIPVGAGLGSSAAAVVAGILLGAGLCRAKPDPATVLRLAVELEGHPDNVAAACSGGLVFAATTDDPLEILTWKTRVPATLRFVAVIPAFALPTAQARAVLPAQYSRRDAVHNLQRAALLAAACFSNRYDLSPELFRDRLHQPYRSSLVPGLDECLALRRPGLLGVFLSGAGPAVLALVRGNTHEVAQALVEAFQGRGVAAQSMVLRADNRGARLAGASARAGARAVAGRSRK
jgi:homoserine kinase